MQDTLLCSRLFLLLCRRSHLVEPCLGCLIGLIGRDTPLLVDEKNILPPNPVEQTGALELQHHARADPGQHELSAVGLQNLVVAIQNSDHGAAKVFVTAQHKDHHSLSGVFGRW